MARINTEPTETRDGLATVQDPNDHLGLVLQAASNLARKTRTEREDHIGAAYIAMVGAARTWNASKGFQFSTHATTAMKFRAYESFKKDTGAVYQRKGVGSRWKEAEKTTEFTEDFASIPKSESVDKSDHMRANIGKILKAARKVSREHGEDAIRLMARGIHPKQASVLVGKKPKFCYYLMKEIGKILDLDECGDVVRKYPR
jgi:Sigma-70 region 2